MCDKELAYHVVCQEGQCAAGEGCTKQKNHTTPSSAGRAWALPLPPQCQHCWWPPASSPHSGHRVQACVPVAFLGIQASARAPAQQVQGVRPAPAQDGQVISVFLLRTAMTPRIAAVATVLTAMVAAPSVASVDKKVVAARRAGRRCIF